MRNKCPKFYKQVMQKGRKWLNFLLFPPRCIVCDTILEPEQIEAGIHSSCERKLFPIYGAVCMHCGRPFRKNLRKIQQKTDIYFDNSTQEYCVECIKRGYVQENSSIIKGKALFLYNGVIKHTMYRLKYSNRREYTRYFARYAKKWYPRLLEVDAIVPVPMYRKKEKRRGYNQAEIFARALSEITGIPVDNKLIFRIKDTIPMKELDDIQRKNNLKNAFQKGENIVKYKKVLIVDDIYTTGATVEAVAQELKYIGVAQVYVLCICIGGEL